MKKIIMPLLVACLIIPCVFMLTACSGLGLTPVETLNGKDGTTPHIGTNGNWWIGDTDTGIQASGNNGANGQNGTNGSNGLTPYIGENFMWWIGEHDTGIRAIGDDGYDGITPHIGADGYWYIGSQNTGHFAIGRTPYPATSSQNPDYTTWWIDGVDTGMVAIGKDAPIPHIVNGNWWIGTTDTGVCAIGQNGKNGENGITPHIGSNGNWWYGEYDTGSPAHGTNGHSPYIIDGYWWINGHSMGIKAEAQDGLTPFIHNGNWWIGGYDTGVVADLGQFAWQIEYLTNYLQVLNDKINQLENNYAVAPVSFALDSWATIANVSALGLAREYYSVGDEKTIMLQDGEILTFIILGFEHDDLANGTGKAKMTLGMRDLMIDGTIANETNTNIGSWEQSIMRQNVDAIFDRLPVDLQAIIKTVNKTSTAGNGGSYTNPNYDTVVTQDRLFLFSRVELDGIDTAGYCDEGTQYEYWINHNTNADRVKSRPSGQTVDKIWRLRSASIYDNNVFISVNPNGAFNTGANSYTATGICFGFCI